MHRNESKIIFQLGCKRNWRAQGSEGQIGEAGRRAFMETRIREALEGITLRTYLFDIKKKRSLVEENYSRRGNYL